MKQGASEIVILKPTRVFLAFLSSQLPEYRFPSMALLQKDNTAYVIAKRNSVSSTLNELEQHFSLMFRHEISRWLGENARNEIEHSFFNFMCCFKLELHSHIILMEPALKEGGQIIVIKPRQALFNWIKSLVEDDDGLTAIMEKINLSHLTENSTILVKNFSALAAIKPFIQRYYKPLFTTLMGRISNKEKQWPVVDSYASFCKYFVIEIHTQLIHMHC
ncbi:MAG: hypothetical protein PSV35_02660 [bacterium]|nr:hypothetical protein [bacterium]